MRVVVLPTPTNRIVNVPPRSRIGSFRRIRVSLLEQRASVCLHVRAFDDPRSGWWLFFLKQTRTGRCASSSTHRVDECRHERPASSSRHHLVFFVTPPCVRSWSVSGKKHFYPHDQFLVYERSSSSNLKTHRDTPSRREKSINRKTLASRTVETYFFYNGDDLKIVIEAVGRPERTALSPCFALLFRETEQAKKGGKTNERTNDDDAPRLLVSSSETLERNPVGGL